MADVRFKSSMDNSQLKTDVRSANQTIAGFVKDTERHGNSLAGTFSKVGERLLAYGSFFAALNIGKQIVEITGQFQQLRIAFETMLDSKEKADRLMSQSIELAQKTPFTLMEVSTNAKQLMAMGVSFEKVMGSLRNLGDVAAGVSVPLSRLAINYGQVLTLGRLQQREIRDFAMAGVPLVAELAKNMGKTAEEIQKLVSEGKIGFAEVEKAFQTMAGEGGKFYNLMEKQNRSITGQMSNLVDKWQVMISEIGEANKGVIYDSMNAASTLMANYKEIWAAIKPIVQILGTYKVALMAITSLQKANLATGYLLEAKALGTLVNAQGAAFLAQNTILRGTKEYEAVLQRMTTEEYRNVIAKKGLTVGTVEYAAAVKGLVLAEQRELQLSIATTDTKINSAKRVIAAKVSEKTALEALMAKQTAELAIITSSGKKKEINIAQRKLAASAQRIEALEMQRLTASMEVETLVTQKNTAQTRLNTIQHGLSTAAKQKDAVATNFLTRSKLALTAATAKLTAVLKANQFAVITALLIGVTVAVYKLVTADTALEKAQKSLNEELKKSREEKENNLSEVEKLINATRDETKGVYLQVKAYDELIKRFKYFEKFTKEDIQKMTAEQMTSVVQQFSMGQDLGSAEQAYRRQIKVIQDLQEKLIINPAFQQQIDIEETILAQLLNNLSNVRRQINEANAKTYGKEYWQNIVDTLEANRDAASKEIVKVGVAEIPSPINAIKNLEIANINKELQSARAMLASFNKAVEVQDKAYWEKELKLAQEVFDAQSANLAGTEEWLAKAAKVKELQEKVNLFNLSKDDKKESDAYIKAQEDVMEKVANLDAQYQAQRVASMRIGYERQVAEIKAGGGEKLAALEKEYSDLRQKMRTGKISIVDGKAVGQGMSQADLDIITKVYNDYQAHRAAITASTEEEIRQLTFDTNVEIKDLLESQTAYFASEMDAQIAYANRRYDNDLIRLQELGVGEEKLFQLRKLHEEEIKRIKADAKIKYIDFQEEIATAIIENGDKVYLFQVTKEKKLLNEKLKAEEERLKEYSRIATKESIQNAAKSAQRIKAMRKELNELSLGEVAEMGDAFERIASSVQSISPSLATALGGAGSLMKNVSGIGNEFKKSMVSGITASVGAFMGAVGTINSLAAINEQKAEQRRQKALKRQLDYLNQINDAIDRGSQISTWLVGQERIDAYSESISNVVYEINSLKGATIDALNNVFSSKAVKNLTGILTRIEQLTGADFKVLDTVRRFESLKNSIKTLFAMDFTTGGGAIKMLNSLEKTLSNNKETIDQLVETIYQLQEEANKRGIDFIKQDELDAAIQAVESLQAVGDKLYEIREQLMEQLTGSSFSSIVDDMVSVFESGFDDLNGMSEQFTTNFQELMQKALLQSFKVKSLEEPLRKWYEKFASEIGDDDKLDSKEIATLQAQYQKIVADGQKEWDNIMKIAGKAGIVGGTTNQTGLIGKIRSELTEATGTELAGIFRSTRDDGRKSLDTMRVGVSHLSKIEKNTADTVARLDLAVSELRDINRNTKGVYSGVL